jgi:hypothetical protein
MLPSYALQEFVICKNVYFNDFYPKRNQEKNRMSSKQLYINITFLKFDPTSRLYFMYLSYSFTCYLHIESHNRWSCRTKSSPISYEAHDQDLCRKKESHHYSSDNLLVAACLQNFGVNSYIWPFNLSFKRIQSVSQTQTLKEIIIITFITAHSSIHCKFTLHLLSVCNFADLVLKKKCSHMNFQQIQPSHGCIFL